MDPGLLQNLGLTKNESKIYYALVSLKSASVNELSRKTDVPRVNIYDILESLKSKGLVASVTKSNKMYFEPANPERLKELLEKKQEEMKKVAIEVDVLKKIFLDKNIRSDVGLFKGKLGIKSVLKEALNEKEILNFGSSGMFPKTYPEYFDIWESQRAKNKIHMRIVASKNLKGKIPEKKLQTIRFLDHEFSSLTSTFIFGEKVATFIWTDEPFAILIENAQLAESQRNYFEFLWKNSK